MPMNRYRLFKQLWNNRYPVRVWGKDVIPPVVKEKGIEVVDPTLPKPEETLSWQPPVPNDPRFTRYYPQKEPSSHPNWHDKPAMFFDYPGQMLSGLKQAQAITNTVVYQKLPANIESSNSQLYDDQDVLAQRICLLAHKWFPGKDRLPKHYWPDFPNFKLRSEQGILRNDTIRMFLHGLLHLCTVSSGQKDAKLLLKRRLLYDPQIVASYDMKNLDGDRRHIVVRGLHAAAISAAEPLPSFATGDEVKQTTDFELPSMGPVSPFIDLESEHIYPKDSTGWSSTLDPEKYVMPISAARYPHTLFLYNKEALWTQEDFEREPWTDEQRNARAIIFTHAWCVAYAKQLYGKDVALLPKPVTAQCIQTDGESFRFLCYQLNTLDCDRQKSVIRNQAWIDSNSENKLFVKTILPKQFARMATYTDYEPAVLSRFVSFFLNGIDNLPAGELEQNAKPAAAVSV